jgi:hypothetical protein
VVNGACDAVTSEQLRKYFVRRCEGGGRGDARGLAETCYWELQRDIIIDAEQHERGFGGLTGKVGRDNYNLRHVDLALNVVGTGVLDCAGTSSSACYASGFVEYDLEHLAYNAPIVDYDRQTHCFDFAKGAVRSGKAIATERYVTLPLGSNERELLSQPAFLKTELFGRPLSGVYRLRIRDTPALVWENLEDIQLVLGYRYWSRVEHP